ncbi:MAG: bacteriohemerythrin [Rhodoferax sp.]|nr:bacteriohemerythrin [Rhodoferax sp.]
MKTGTETIAWNDRLMTGIPLIDEQHQILVNMLNDANVRMTHSIGRDVLEEMVRDLMSYALYHFDIEEELMLDSHYQPAQQERHVREHRRFSETVAQVRQNLLLGKLISREELLGFLNDWLINHILHTDMEFARYLQQSKFRDD